MPDELHTTMPTPATAPDPNPHPTIDTRLAHLRAEHDRVRALIAESAINVQADDVHLTLTRAAARELFALLDVGISLGVVLGGEPM